MAIDFSRLRETIRGTDKLALSSEYLSVLDAIIELLKADCAALDEDATRDIISRRKRLREICDSIYLRLNDGSGEEDLEGLVNTLESEVATLESKSA